MEWNTILIVLALNKYFDIVLDKAFRLAWQVMDGENSFNTNLFVCKNFISL